MNLRFEEERKKERRIQILKEAIWLIVAVGLVILLAWLIVEFALKKVGVIGSAMETTLYNGEDVIVNRAAYTLLAPGRNAIIAFYPEQQEGEEVVLDDSMVLIRRVIGLPGETVQIKEGKVYIDGEELEEKYPFEPMASAGRVNHELKLGEDEYFVLCDNRRDMDDSRNTSFTKVKRENIIGKVMLRLNPFALIGGPEEKEKDETDEEKQ